MKPVGTWQHDLADPASKRETFRPWWCCRSHFGIVLLRFLARAEQQRRKEMRQAELALKKLEQAAAQEAKEQLFGGEKKRHVTPHVGLQVAKARNDKRAKKKRELRERRKEAGAINFKAIRSSEAEMFRLMLPGLGRVAHAKREGPSTAKKEPGEKVRAAQNAAKAAGGATRCPNLTRKICSLCRLRTVWKRAKATKRNLSWKRARCSVENVLKLLKQAKGGKQDRATGCYQPFPTLILGCFIWFKIIFLCSISFI